MKPLVRSFYEHRWLLGLIGVYAAAAKLLGLWLGFPVLIAIYDPTTARFAYLVPVLAAIARACYVGLVERPELPLEQLWEEWLHWVRLDRLFGLLICLLALPAFLSVFTSLKSTIPVVAPFSWDDALHHLDHFVHGGVDPWRLLQPMLGRAPVTAVFAAAYHAWYFVVYLTVMGVCWSTRHGQLRMQFLMTFVLCWILLGNVVATLLSSAGPVYFGRVTGLQDPYAGLVAYLDSAGAISRRPQEALWASYEAGRIAFRSGISAMPSMHVAMVTLIALLGWRVHRLAGLLATLFAIVIMIGSVHLAWHYAVDGYISAAGVVAIWHAVGWFQRRVMLPTAAATAAAGDAATDPGPAAAERPVRELR